MSKRPTRNEAKALLTRFGSPLFVTYKESIQKNIALYKTHFRSYAGGFSLAYSIKTNNNPVFLEIFRKQDVIAEVCSQSDIVAAKLAGYRGEEMIFDGLVKTDEELRAAIKDNISLINLESFGEAVRLAKLAERAKKTVNVGIRLSFPSSRVGLKSLLGISYDRFGVSRASGEATKVAHFVLNQKYLRLTGLHCHTGSNQKSSAHYLVGINELTTFMKFLKQKYNCEIKILNLGGGFGVPEITAYKISDFAIQTVQRLLQKPTDFFHRPFDFNRTSAEIISHLEKKLDEYRLPFPHVMLEPGRSLVGNTTHLLTTIVETKQTDKNNWLIIDAGTNLMPVLTFYSEYHDIVVFSKSRLKRKTSIAGPLLYSSDSLISGRILPLGQVGDVILVCDTGAYFNCQANQFLYPRAASILIDGANKRVVERRETIKDIFNRVI